MPRRTMVEAIRDAMDVMMARDGRGCRLRRGCRLLRRRVPLHRGAAAQARRGPLLRYADFRIRHHRRRRRHGRLRPASGGRDPVRRLHVSGLRPDRLRGGAAALPLGRRVHRAPGGAHALRRRHLRRADPQPEPGGAVHPCLRPEDRHPLQPARRQGPADRGHRGRRPGHLPGAEADLQRPLRRPSRPARGALVAPCARRDAGRALHGAARRGARCGGKAPM